MQVCKWTYWVLGVLLLLLPARPDDLDEPLDSPFNCAINRIMSSDGVLLNVIILIPMPLVPLLSSIARTSFSASSKRIGDPATTIDCVRLYGVMVMLGAS